MYQCEAKGWGKYVPSDTLTNSDLVEMLKKEFPDIPEKQTSDEWITQRTGMKNRYIAKEYESNVSMAIKASEEAIKDADIKNQDIDIVVVGTNTTNIKKRPRWYSLTSLLASALELTPGKPFFDIQTESNGLEYALLIAEKFIKSGQYKTIAVAQAKNYSPTDETHNIDENIFLVHQNKKNIITEYREKLNIPPENIEMVIAGINYDDKNSAATDIAKSLNLSNTIMSFDVGAGCAGATYAEAVIEKLVKSGYVKTALCCGVEHLTAMTDYKDRNTCVLFGDGAGAVVFQQSNKHGIIYVQLGGDHTKRNFLKTEKRKGLTLEHKEEERNYLQMDGKKIFPFASRVMQEDCLKVLDKSEISLDKIAKIVPHQMNLRIIQSCAREIAKKTGLDQEYVLNKMYIVIEKYANTSTASTLLAIYDAIKEGAIKKGDKIISPTVGAGLAHGAALVEI